VREAVDQRDDAGGVGEDLVAFGGELAGGQDDRPLALVAAVDDPEEQVGVAGVVGEIPELV